MAKYFPVEKAKKTLNFGIRAPWDQLNVAPPYPLITLRDFWALFSRRFSHS